MKRKTQIQKVPKSTFGLALLLERAISSVCVAVLLMSPLAPLFAADEAVAEETAPVTVETPKEPESESPKESIDESVPVDVPTPDMVTSTDEPSDTTNPTDAIQVSPVPGENMIEMTPIVSPDTTTPVTDTTTIPPITDSMNALPEPSTENSTSEEVVDEVSGTSSDTTSELIATSTVTEVAPLDPVLVSNEPTVPHEIADTATSTEVAEIPEGETVELSAITNDQNRFVFGKSECVSAGDETFYCTKGVPDAAPVHEDRVFSAVDTDGDKEIYTERNSVISKITDNDVDDDAPYFDELSNTIVWHRLIEGRYQVISYNIAESKETQITHDRFNNMEPHRYGKTTVWQGWVGNDWEIMMLEGDELTMLTDNTTHDITPSINGDHIVWQSFEGDAWKMKVYDIRTKEIHTIEDAQGGSIENPRFVLVYDTKLETGDVETRGFNLETGEVVSLGAKPATVPEDIPDPDQTGEKRAIVSPVIQPKTKIDESDDNGDDSTGGEPPVDSDAIHEGDLVIPQLTIDDEGSATTTQSSTSTERDLIIHAPEPFATTSVSHIDDLVIPAFLDRQS